ncbi:Man1-Src1p-C-terminal domain-containing protein [Geopyxis carbonaria]|nr:Man1-Src1p-C-terminal domain-containing protein [Geopyxis carbonaria]
METEQYLQPGFDPNTLKVSELRGVLLKHDVDYSSSIKKAELVALFKQHVAPRAHTLRQATSRVKPSAHGMVDAATLMNHEEPVEEVTPRRSRRSTRAIPDFNNEDQGGPILSTRKVTPRKQDDQRLPRGDLGSGESFSRSGGIPSSSLRKTSTVETYPDAEHQATKQTEPSFSSFNPFQMGSSPVTLKSPERVSRKSMGSERKRRSVSRRRTDVGASNSLEDFATSSMQRKKHRPDVNTSHIHALNKEEPEDTIGLELEVGEEFVPEEAQGLAESQNTIRGESKEFVSTRTGLGALWTIVLFIILGYGLWWRKEKIEAGYCGVAGLDIRNKGGELAEFLRPECEPCPYHARCFPGMQLACDDDYVEIPKWGSLGGILPIAPECLPDSEKERRKSIISNAALDILRESGAEERCKERFLRSDESIQGVLEEDLRKVLYDRKSVALSDKEFSELWRLALDEVSHQEEVIVETANNRTILKSTSLAALPLGCSIRFFITRSMVQHRISIAAFGPGLILAVIVTVKINSLLSSNKAYRNKVTRLVHIALTHLVRNAAKHPDSPSIAVAHLRDQVLQQEFDSKKRKYLWEGVEKIVEMNSNVRVSEREIQGEMMTVWTWIGGKFTESGPPIPDLSVEEEDWNLHRRPVA